MEVTPSTQKGAAVDRFAPAKESQLQTPLRHRQCHGPMPAHQPAERCTMALLPAGPEVSWRVTRRFSQFDAHESAYEQARTASPALPQASAGGDAEAVVTPTIDSGRSATKSSAAGAAWDVVRPRLLRPRPWACNCVRPPPPPMLDGEEHGFGATDGYSVMLERFHQRSDQRHVASAQPTPGADVVSMVSRAMEDQIATLASETRRW